MHCRPCYAAGRRQCAKCAKEVLEVPPRLAEAIAEQFRVRCSFADKGCPDTIQFKVRRNVIQIEQICSPLNWMYVLLRMQEEELLQSFSLSLRLLSKVPLLFALAVWW